MLYINKIIDGDTVEVMNSLSKETKTIRLLGIDAPETYRSRKLKQDERETHIAGELLIKMGKSSKQYLADLLPIGTQVLIRQELKQQKGFYKRALGYIISPDGYCVNEIMVKDGYAKAYNKYWCGELKKYQILNYRAIKENLGLYKTMLGYKKAS
ncbi:MAG: hypothetical protein COC01_08675 [Bacteroidetes bacterium]|nr:MAG: hypothetical protein COC01_08675 [Bacteroidota bacterium]